MLERRSSILVSAMSEGILGNKKVCDVCGSDKTRIQIRKNGPYARWYGKRLGARICDNCYKTLKRHHKKEQVEQIKCACGCGEIISSIDTKLRPQQFKWGHGIVGKVGPKHPSWGGGRKVRNGYWTLYTPDHHFADKKHYVFEHRLVWEYEHKACLLECGDVHHKDHNPLNNVWYNLQAMMHGEHSKLH